MKSFSLQRSVGVGIMALALAAAAPVDSMAREDAFPANIPSLMVSGNGSYAFSSAAASSITIPASHVGQTISVKSDAAWASATVSPDGIEVNATANPNTAARRAILTVANAKGQTVQLTIDQPGDAMNDTATDGIVYATPSSVAASSSENGEGPERTLDNNLSTLWHSSYSGFTPGSQNVTITYKFEGGTTLESFVYYPRTSGGINGNFGEVDVKITTSEKGRPKTISEMSRDLKFSYDPATFTFPEEYRNTTIYSVQIVVKTGGTVRGDGKCYASCAEMKFIVSSESQALQDDSKVFADGIFSALAPGVDQARVDKMADPYLKSLAQKMLTGQYSNKGRIAEIKTFRGLDELAASFNAPGKKYDQINGVTGITMTRGRYVIIVEGIPERFNNGAGTTELRVMGWCPPDRASGPRSESFTIHNGINIIDRTTDWDGLAYIANYDEEGYQNGTGSTIRAHFVGAPVNGFITPYMTNEEIKTTLANATHCIMDCLGQKVHSVWEVEALQTHASDRWVKYLNTLDLIIFWEHRLLGLEKYNRLPPNQTMAYVNYTFYMFQGGYGVSFKYDTQYRVCNPDVIISSDDDALWGLSHEWGHQHQMHPYFCWTGMAESSNNIFSAYNVLHMGYPVTQDNYRGRFPKEKWLKNAQKIFLDDDYNRTIAPPKDGENKQANEGDNMVLSLRGEAKRAAQEGRQWSWNKELYDFAVNQPMLPSLRAEDPSRAVNEIEAYSSANGELTLTPWVRLQFYFAEEDVPGRAPEDYRPDLYPDFFEALRQCDEPEGSTVEKTGIDKYELLVSAHNGNKNGKREVFRQMFPNSCWTTHDYLPADRVLNWQDNSAPAIMNAIRKLSRLTGYNLWDYFQRWGAITICALEQGDYGIHHYAVTPEIYEEFRADMQALEDAGELRPLPEDVFEAISRAPYPSFPVPNIPNDRPITTADF